MAKNPQRYRDRHEPVDKRPLGEPPAWLKPEAQAAWREYDRTMPWLRRCHRGHVGITALLAGKLARGQLGLPGMNLLRQCLGKMGATPSDFSKVGWSTPEEDDDDDLDDDHAR
jgi:hypothetical protein